MQLQKHIESTSIPLLMKFPILLATLVAGLFLNPCQSADANPKFQLPPFKKVVLNNGMTVLLMEQHSLPMIDFCWMMKSGGSIQDPPGKEGLATITAELLRKGTTSRTSKQFSEAVDFVGGLCDAGASLEYSAGSAEFMKKDVALALDLLSDMLQHPAFSEEEAAKLIKQEVDGIADAKTLPRQVIGQYYQGFLYGPHPYARPAGGTEISLTNISRGDITVFYSNQYAPNTMILAVAGDFASDEMEASLRKSFGSWTAKQIPLTAIPEPQKTKGRHALIIDKPDSTQTFFEIGNIGLARTNADWITVEVVNTLFGGRFTSMINNELRIQSGLTYGAVSQFSKHLAPGSFLISSYTPNASTQRALDMTLDVLKRLHEKGVSEEQLKSAKAYIKGQFGPTLETSGQLVNLLCDLEFYDLNADYINTYFDRIDATTLEDTKRIIKTYFPLNDLSIVLIGQSSVIEPVAQKLAVDVKKKAITAPGY